MKSVQLSETVNCFESADGAYDAAPLEGAPSPTLAFDEGIERLTSMFAPKVTELLVNEGLTHKQRMAEFEKLLSQFEEALKMLRAGRKVAVKIDGELSNTAPEATAAESLAADAAELQRPSRRPSKRWLTESLLGVFRARLPRADKLRSIDAMLRSGDDDEVTHIRPCTPGPSPVALAESSKPGPYDSLEGTVAQLLSR